MYLVIHCASHRKSSFVAQFLSWFAIALVRHLSYPVAFEPTGQFDSEVQD